MGGSCGSAQDVVGEDRPLVFCAGRALCICTEETCEAGGGEGQLVFLIAFYRILISISQAGLTIDPSQLYPSVANPGKINQLFIGLVDLTKPSIIIAAGAAIAQYFQTKMLMGQQLQSKPASSNGQPDMAQMMSKQMLYLGPFLTLFIGIRFAAGLSLYWLTSTLFMLIQQILIQKKQR